MGERIEAVLRIIVAVISGFVLGIWKILIQILAVLHWIIVIITGARLKSLAEFCEIWNTQIYVYLRYLTFVSNKRPFPFEKLEKNITKYR